MKLIAKITLLLSEKSRNKTNTIDNDNSGEDDILCCHEDNFWDRFHFKVDEMA